MTWNEPLATYDQDGHRVVIMHTLYQRKFWAVVDDEPVCESHERFHRSADAARKHAADWIETADKRGDAT